jgi:eukaryotic-like serine/threonine-protein kinase
VTPLAHAHQHVGPYETMSRLGAGGMGEVWKARDTRLRRDVAIKFSRVQFSDRFEREARAIAQLNHPNICTLHDVGPDYLVMEFVDGEPLKGPLPLPKVIDYAGQICDALDAAHAKGITHRDLKPANVLVTDGRVKLLDFGLARMEAAQPTPGEDTITHALTGPGVVLGTPQYMAPEQIEGKPTDARSDIFALGCVIYEMIVGRRAFDGDSASSIATAILARDPQPIPDAPPLLRQIVNTCLAKDPAQRFQNARDLKLALQWVCAAAPAVPTQHSKRWLVAAACTVLASSGLTLWSWLQRGHLEPVQFPLTPPGFRLADHYIDVPVPSPDGTRILFTVFNEAGRRQLAVWSLTRGSMQLLDKTDEVRTAFWSPDGESVGLRCEVRGPLC